MAALTFIHPHVVPSRVFGNFSESSSFRHTAASLLTAPAATVNGKKLMTKAAGRQWYSSTQRFLSRRPASSRKKHRCLIVSRSSSSSDEAEEQKVAPLVPQSPAGLFLSQILGSYPHLFPAAAEQQLDMLVAERDQQEEEGNTSELQSSDNLILYRRMNDVKESDRRCAIEDIIYALVVEKFFDAKLKLIDHIPLLPLENLTPAHLHRAMVPQQEKELHAVHSREMQEMVVEHLKIALLGSADANLMRVDDRVVVEINRMTAGQMYAASVMYGYFLKRMDERFQLDKKLKAASEADTVDLDVGDVEQGGGRGWGGGGEVPSSVAEVGLGSGREGDSSASLENPLDSAANDDALAAEFMSVVRMRESQNEFQEQRQSPEGNTLREYIMSFDPEGFQETAKMRSREGVNVIEKQTAALFGAPQLLQAADGSVTVGNNDEIRLPFLTVRTLILEAMAFGSFLWGVESHVDRKYELSP